MKQELRQWATLSHATGVFSDSGSQKYSNTIFLLNPVPSHHKEDITCLSSLPSSGFNVEVVSLTGPAVIKLSHN